MNEDKLATLNAALLRKAEGEYQTEVNKAVENLKVVIAQGPTGWIDSKHSNELHEVVEKMKAKAWPRIWHNKVAEFLTTYEKLVTEFPQLQQQAYEEGQENPNG